MRILVTGGAGHLGKHLVKRLEERGHEVHTLDIAPGVGEFYHSVDILDAVAVRLLIGLADIVFHLAGRVGRVVSVASPECTLRLNVLGAYNIASACSDSGTPLIHVSTSEGYGRIVPQAETATCAPVTWYGATKLMGEQVVNFHRENEGLRACIVRPFMMYHEDESPLAHRSAMAWFAHCIANEIPFKVHKDSERAWLHYDDATRYLADLAETEEWPKILNIGHHDWRSMRWLADYIGKILGKTPQYDMVDAPGGITLVKRPTLEIQDETFGYPPRVSLKEGVHRVCGVPFKEPRTFDTRPEKC